MSEMTRQGGQDDGKKLMMGAAWRPQGNTDERPFTIAGVHLVSDGRKGGQIDGLVDWRQIE